MNQVSEKQNLSLLSDLITISYNSKSFKEALTNVLQILRSYLKSDLIEIWAPHVEENTIQLLHNEFDVSDIPIKNFVTKSLETVYTTEQYTATPVWIKNTIQWLQLGEVDDLLVRQKIAITAGIQTVITFPVLINEKPIAIIYVFYKEKILKNELTENILTVCAKQLSILFEQSSLYHLHYNFLNKSTDLICITNFKGQLLDCSNSFQEMLGLNKKDILNNLFTDFSTSEKIDIDSNFINTYSKNPKETFDLEYKFKNKMHTITWNATIVEEEYRIIFSGKDITQKILFSNTLKQNNTLLEQAYGDLSSILNNTNEIIYKLDLTGTIIEVSASVTNTLGYQQHEIVGKSFLFFTHVDEVEKIYELVITNINNNNIVKQLKHRIKAKNLTWKWLITSGQTIFDSNGNASHIICISKDISESNALDENNKEIKEKYKKYFSANPLPVFICDLEEQNILESNAAACNLYGYTSDEFTFLKPDKLKSEELPDNFSQYYTINEKQSTANTEKIQKHIKKDGTVFFAKVCSSQILIDNKLCLICTIIDISKEIKKAESIKYDATFADYFLENTKDSYYCFTAKNPIPIHINLIFLGKKIAEDFFLSAANDVYVKRYGFETLEKIQGLSLKEISKIQQLDYKFLLQEFIRKDFLLKDYNLNTINAAGEKNYFVVNIKGIVENGKLSAIIGSSRNITDKTNAENALKRSLETFESITDNTTDSISRYEFTPPVLLLQDKEILKKEIFHQAHLVESNSVLSKRLGLKNKEALYGYSLIKLLTIQQFDMDTLFDAFIQANYSLSDFEMEIKDLKGNIHYISITVKSEIQDHKLIRIWTSSKNISAEKTEKKKTEFLANIINQVKDVIYTTDQEFNIITWNRGAENIFGLKKEEVTGKKIIDLLKYQYENLERKDVLSILEKTGSWMGEVKFLHPITNQWTTLLSTISKSEKWDTNNEGYIITSKDISEKKLADAKIEETESRFKTIADFAPVMIWQTGKIGEKYFYNQKISEFTGLSKEQLLATPWEELVLPEDQNIINPYLKKQIQNQQPFSIEYRLKHHTGEYKWILDKATPRVLADGSFDGYIGICVDIHDTKKSFEIIKESEERFRNMADAAPVMIWLTNEKDQTTYYNEGWLRFTGKSLEEELAIPWASKIFEPDRENAEKAYEQAYANKEPFLLEYRLISKNNEIKWVLDRGTPRFLKNGDFAGYIGVCIDIHYLKQIEIDLKYANERYEIINEAANKALFESDLKKGIGYWGAGFKKFFGYDLYEVNTEKWLSLVHPDDRNKAKKTFIDYDIETLQKNNIIHCTYRFLKGDNTYCYVEDLAYVIFDENGIPEKLIGSKKDITEQKELEQKVLRNEIDKQVAINKAMIEGQEKEKLELSQELHDNINQLISSAKLYMEVAKRNNEKNEMINKSIETLSQAVQEMRRLSKSLNPATINKLDLVDAIEQLVSDVEETGKLVVVFDYSKFNYNITLPQLNLYLYRIVQEQINNILKYAKTEIAYINLENNEHYLFLKIADEGVGFDKTIKSKGIGLHNITNRVELFKGKINIISEPDKGCSIEINIPLNVEYF